MTNEQREALLAGKPTKEFDITKHRDWQKWGILAQKASLGAVERHSMLELAFRAVAPLIYVAGQAAARARIAELEAALKPFAGIETDATWLKGIVAHARDLITAPPETGDK